jgi:hypothetical protein
MSFEALLQSADAKVHSRLGDSCVYAPSSGPEVTLPCVYDAAYVLAEPRGPGVSSSAPAVFVRAEQLPGGWEADVGAKVTRAGVEYSIVEPKPDGQGGVLLVLHVTS